MAVVSHGERLSRRGPSLVGWTDCHEWEANFERKQRMKAVGSQRAVRFGTFEVELRVGELRKNGRKVNLQQKATPL